ncbi:phosphatase inhibitor-domain-containing protein [Blakeslea trispora]|nr:phosphatase inhibitor-domain-containing protein [Blakeslea trispora]
MSSSPHPATSTRMREETPTTTHGSRTITLDETAVNSAEEMSSDEEGEQVGVLRLTGDMASRRRRVIQWDESVVDNEHMNKKKSKICCIYHKPRPVGESSDDSSSSSSDDSSNSDSEDSHSGRCNHRHNHRRKKRNPRDVSPNAYERQPVYKDRIKPVNQPSNA